MKVFVNSPCLNITDETNLLPLQNLLKGIDNKLERSECIEHYRMWSVDYLCEPPIE